MAEDIIRRVQIQAQADEASIKQASSTLDNFYKKYQNKTMKVDTSDFFKAVDAVRTLRKELDSTQKHSPHMEGIIGHMSGELERAGKQFSDAIVHFTNGDIVKGLNAAVDKVSQGFSIKSVDLGDFLSSMTRSVKETTDALDKIGAIDKNVDGTKWINLNHLNASQLEQAIALMQKLKDTQSELDAFNGTPLKGRDFYSNTSTRSLSNYVQEAQADLEKLEMLNLDTISTLREREYLINDLNNGLMGKYSRSDVDSIKLLLEVGEKEAFDREVEYLREYVTEREELLQQLNQKSYLLQPDEFDSVDTIKNSVGQAKLYLEELQQLSPKVADVAPSGGNFTEVVRVLNEIKISLQEISGVFQNTEVSMHDMAESSKLSFEGLSQTITEVYNNLTQIQSLIDDISKKDFNITNITQTGGGDSNLQAMTKQMAVAREQMEHLRALYDQAGDTIQGLASKGHMDQVLEYQKQLAEFDLNAITKSVKGANTEMKLASVLAEMQDYIDKFTQINELRNKFDLGGWKDTFVPTQQPVVKPTVQSKTQPIITQPQNNIVTNNTEAQQMWQLKAAIDEVTNAIGRKNAGFVKEAEIVNTSVSAEESKLRELVNIITSDIGNALDNIKTQFTDSFVVPGLDKNNLQTSFNEIYNKFVELKDNIGTMQIDVGINTANITTAIQEALYAKEIAANYQEVKFEDIFESNFYDGTWINRFTGEIFDTFDAVDEEFENAFKGLFKSTDGYFLGRKEDVMADFLRHQGIDNAPEHNDWAQVIVEAINTQGGNIVESIKLLLPKNMSENVDAINEKEVVNAFQVLVNAIESFSQQTGKKPDAFFRSIEAKNTYANSIRTPEVDNALRTLGLLSSSGEITFTIPDTGVRNIGVAIGERLVASGQEKSNVSNASELMRKLNEAAALGASVPRILSLIEKDNIPLGWAGTGDAVFQLQTRSPGVNIASAQANNDFSGITDAQIDRLIHTFEVMSKVGLYPDFIGDNILFDKQKGFSLIDLETENIHARSMDDAHDMVQAFLKNVFREANLSSSDFQKFSDRVNQRLKLPPEKRLVNENTISTEQTVATQSQESKPSEVKITPTMDEGAIAKLIDENVAKTPAEVKVTPVVDSASNSEQAVDGESQSAVNAAQTFVDAANAKKQFVEANKQVASSAKESANAVKEETKAAEQAKQTMVTVADDTVQPNNWDRIAQLQTDHGEDPFALRRSKTENVEDKSVRTIVESWSAIKDEDGNLTGEMELNTVQIINDFKKRTDAITKENEKIKTAQAYLQKFLTQFDNKTMGKGSLLSGYQELNELANRDNDDPNSEKFTIDDISRAEQMMSSLDAEYNKVVQSMRKGSSSMNPFVNAINSMDKMEDVLRGISLQFKTLNQQPDWLNEAVTNLYRQLDDLSVETDIYKFAEGFGNLKVSINSVTESIRQQRVEQKLATSDFNALIKATKARDLNFEKAMKQEDGSAWQTYYLNRATEQQQIIDAIRIGLTLTEAQETALNALSEKHALILSDITLENDKTERQKQNYEELISLLQSNHNKQAGLENGSISVVDKSAYQQVLEEERAVIDELIKGADLNPQQTKSIEQLVKLIADLRVESSNIDVMSKKWAEQNVLTDEAKTKVEALRQSLLKVSSGTELGVWKKQWKELANEMSMANMDKKAIEGASKLIENDSKTQVQEYINLLKLKNDYEQKALKGGSMQPVYEAKVVELKERLAQIDISSIANQEEKNKLLAIEEAHQIKIEEIKRNQFNQKSFKKQNDKLQGKFDAGYLNQESFGKWQTELATYQNYLNGTVKASDATIQDQKRNLMQLYDHLNKISNASKSFFASGGEMLPKWLNQNEINNATASLHSLYETVVAEKFEGMKTSITGVNETLGKLNFVVDDGNGSLTRYTLALDKVSGATKLLQSNAKPALTVIQELQQGLRKGTHDLMSAVIQGSGVHAFVNYMRQGIQSVRELNHALTELKKVTDETEATYDRFLSTAGETSARIGSTLTNMTSATAEFAKLGYDIKTASSMAESALVYTNVGDNIDVETGSQSIISTLKAFGIEADNTMSIVDKFNEIGNNFAITTGGIGEALQVSASAMAAAGNTLDETIALTTAANTIVQNPNTVGTALKTLSLRIRGVKTE